MTQLQRLVVDYRGGEFLVRALYRTQDGPGPNTKARKREVEQLVREASARRWFPSRAAPRRRAKSSANWITRSL
jgi:hypothetical protein